MFGTLLFFPALCLACAPIGWRAFEADPDRRKRLFLVTAGVAALLGVLFFGLPVIEGPVRSDDLAAISLGTIFAATMAAIGFCAGLAVRRFMD